MSESNTTPETYVSDVKIAQTMADMEKPGRDLSLAYEKKAVEEANPSRQENGNIMQHLENNYPKAFHGETTKYLEDGTPYLITKTTLGCDTLVLTPEGYSILSAQDNRSPASKYLDLGPEDPRYNVPPVIEVDKVISDSMPTLVSTTIPSSREKRLSYRVNDNGAESGRQFDIKEQGSSLKESSESIKALLSVIFQAHKNDESPASNNLSIEELFTL